MLTIRKNYSLLGHNTFGIDAETSFWAEYGCADELREVSAMLSDGRLPSPWLHIGSGSNLLFTHNWPGTVLHSCVTGIEIVSMTSEHVTVRAGAGMLWDSFVETCVSRGWYGAENLSAVPGEVGAAAVQNIGAYGTEMSDIVQEVEVMDLTSGRVSVFSAENCGYGYRQSVFKLPENKKYAVLSVVMKLSLKPVFNLSYKALAQAVGTGENISLGDVRAAVCAIRSSKLPDPAEIGSAGSFFTNPVVTVEKLRELQEKWPEIPFYATDAGDGNSVKLSAGWLIEKCGWKGRSVGKAGVYGKQALVLVNLGGAGGEEIASLAAAVREDVRAGFGVELKAEVNII